MSEEESTTDGTAEFIATLLPALVVAGVFCTLFVLLRERKRNVYAPRASWLRKAYRAPDLPAGPFRWIRAVWDVEESYLIENVGMDAAVFLRLFKMGVTLFSTCAVLAAATLATNKSGENGLTGLSSLSMANVADESSLMWVHVVAMWAISGVIYYNLHKNYNEILALTQSFKATHMENYSVLVRDLPEALRGDEELSTYFEEQYPRDFYAANVARHIGKLEAKVGEFATLSRELDHHRAVWAEEQASGKPAEEMKRPMMAAGKLPMAGLVAGKVDAIEFLEKRTGELREEIEASRNGGGAEGEHKASTAGIVTFRSLAAASAAAQVKHAVQPGTVSTDLAPEPREIFWPGMLMPPLVRATQGNIVSLMTVGLSVAYVFPIIAVASISDLDSLSKNDAFSWLSFVNDLPAAVRGILQGLLPVILLAVLMALVPIILRQFAQREGAVSESAIQSRVFGSYYAFQVVYVFFFTMLSKSLFSKLSEVTSDPSSIPTLLGEAVPAAGNFFISYVTLQALGQFPGELCRIAPLILTHIKLKGAKTDVERMEIMEPGSVDYGSMLPVHLVIYLVCLAYAVIHPIISIFGLIYFALGYITWKHQMLMVYTPIAESGGANWHRIFKFVIVGVAISQATLIGVVSLKKGVAQGPFLLPLPLITYLFYNHFASRYADSISSKKLSREVAARVDREKGEGVPSEADLGTLHAAFRQPALVYDLDDILYQTSGRSKSCANLAALPPMTTWDLDNAAAAKDGSSRTGAAGKDAVDEEEQQEEDLEAARSVRSIKVAAADGDGDEEEEPAEAPRAGRSGSGGSEAGGTEAQH